MKFNNSSKNNKKNSNKNNKISKMKDQVKKYTLLKLATWIFLFIPILFVGYLYMTSTISGASFGDLLVKNPFITVSFIIAMINPFCGIICKQAIQDLEEGRNQEAVKVNLMLLTVCQILLLNIIGFVVLLISLIKSFEWKKKSLKEAFLAIKRRYLLTRLSITCGVFVLSSICALLLIRVNHI